MVNGIWGTLSLGLFAAGKYGAPTSTGADVSSPLAGLFYGGGFGVLKAQIIGSAAVTAAAFAGGLAVMYLVKATGTLRVSAEGELAACGSACVQHSIPCAPILPFRLC